LNEFERCIWKNIILVFLKYEEIFFIYANESSKNIEWQKLSLTDCSQSEERKSGVLESCLIDCTAKSKWDKILKEILETILPALPQDWLAKKSKNNNFYDFSFLCTILTIFYQIGDQNFIIL
jgi:hypothetical protein